MTVVIPASWSNAAQSERGRNDEMPRDEKGATSKARRVDCLQAAVDYLDCYLSEASTRTTRKRTTRLTYFIGHFHREAAHLERHFGCALAACDSGDTATKWPETSADTEGPNE